jgi:DNA-binding transcriptional ArsR family regulator
MIGSPWRRRIDAARRREYLTFELSNAPVKFVSLDHLSLTFAALADPTRRAILARLASGEASVGELAQPFAISGPAISRHLKVLEQAGLISRGREAQLRPARIEPAALKRVDDWLERYRQFWDARLDRLEAYLEEVQTAEMKSAPRKRNRRKP